MLDKFNFEIIHFFPLDKVDWAAGTYDQYLYDLNKTVEDNLSAGNYQVAFFHSHLFFMAYVYYSVGSVYNIAPKRALDVYFSIKPYVGNDKKPDLATIQNVYDLSVIPEKEIFKVFHALNMSNEEIQNLSRYVSDRDAFAHATGKGNIDDTTYCINISNIVKNMNEIHKLFRKPLASFYMDFLLQSYSKEYADFIERVEDFLFENSCSFADLYFICNIGLGRFRNENEEFKNNFRHIKKRHLAFVEFCMIQYDFEIKNKKSELQEYSYLLFKYKDRAFEYIEEELGLSYFSSMKDGGMFPLHECPYCEQEQLTIKEDGNYLCFACGEEFASDTMKECSSCGKLVEKNEMSICQNCFDYITSKDD